MVVCPYSNNRLVERRLRLRERIILLLWSPKDLFMYLVQNGKVLDLQDSADLPVSITFVFKSWNRYSWKWNLFYIAQKNVDNIIQEILTSNKKIK